MTLATARGEKYSADFEALTRSRPVPEWMAELRQRGWEHFDSIGFPTARRGNELWKYTNLAALGDGAFVFQQGDPGNVSIEELRQRAPWSDDWSTLVFIDGRYSETLSQIAPDAGVEISNLGDAGDNGSVRDHLARHAPADESAFTALNTAFLADGGYVRIPDNHEAASPIQLLFMITPGASRATYPRTLVIAGANSRAEVIESYVSLGDESGFTSPVAEYVLDSGAGIEHYRVLVENEESFHIGTTRVYQSDNSTFNSVSFALGPKIGRNDIHTMLDAPGAECTLNGLYLTTNDQHMDNHISTTHAKPHGTSHQFYKGVLSGNSRAVFSGRVLVEKDAQKTQAYQKDLNLVLSHGAEIDTKPSLEIYADDVQCAHGATAGHTDPEALFYMQARGIDEKTAQAMLMRGFAAEIVDDIGVQVLQDYVHDVTEKTIPSLQAAAD
ncbi:MAG: Fe-S cluster assembly protein SufD [Dehalococcoidia bacterium]|jgi:Fe-S cluster assembly protein SufD|nr:Fe-S cluster assembly protein SufD [Dehalococcoidia bacterium]